PDLERPAARPREVRPQGVAAAVLLLPPDARSTQTRDSTFPKYWDARDRHRADPSSPWLPARGPRSAAPPRTGRSGPRAAVFCSLASFNSSAWEFIRPFPWVQIVVSTRRRPFTRVAVSSKKTGRQIRRRRKRGRPFASEETAGRAGIVAAARRLLEDLPPHRVTVVMIAREAGVDPAMVRYYFASREELFLAVTENIVLTWVAGHPPPVAPPAERL